MSKQSICKCWWIHIIFFLFVESIVDRIFQPRKKIYFIIFRHFFSYFRWTNFVDSINFVCEQPMKKNGKNRIERKANIYVTSPFVFIVCVTWTNTFYIFTFFIYRHHIALLYFCECALFRAYFNWLTLGVNCSWLNWNDKFSKEYNIHPPIYLWWLTTLF